MSEESNIPPQDSGPSVGNSGPSSENSWQDVGRKFEELGASLAQAVRAGWENQSTQQHVQEMRNGLETMVKDVSRAIEDSANSPQGQKVRKDAERAAETLRSATEQTVQEVRPQLISALEQLNGELQRLVNRMNEKTNPPSGSPPAGEPPAGSPPPIEL